MKKSHNTPRSKSVAAKLPFYYGWVIILVVIISTVVSGVGQTFGISVFNPSILKSLDINLSSLSGAYMAGTLLAALPQPFLGSLMDRFGIRRTMLGITLLLGASCIFFSTINSLLSLLIGFFLLRLLGHGAFILFTNNTPPMWFRNILGSATGIVSFGFPISMAVVPAFFLYLNNQIGWRASYMRLGFLVWIILLPILVFIFRDNPQEIGLEMEGSPAGSNDQAKANQELEISYTVKEARRTPAFWILIINMAIWSMVFAAVFFNLLSIFTSLGISEEVAVSTYTTFAVSSLFAQLLMGPVANRGPLQYLLLASMGLLAAGIALLSIATTPWIAQGYAVLFGLSNGLISLVNGTLFPRYFGRANLGKLHGFGMTIKIAATSLGPFITGLIYDLTGSFQISLWIFIVILIPAGIFSLKATQPEKPIRQDIYNGKLP
jgi:OFA family oxalate/formate antiporter-like MFS transporter